MELVAPGVGFSDIERGVVSLKLPRCHGLVRDGNAACTEAQNASGTRATRPQAAIRARAGMPWSRDCPTAHVLEDIVSTMPPISAAATRPRTSSGTIRCSRADPYVQSVDPAAFAMARNPAAAQSKGEAANAQ